MKHLYLLLIILTLSCSQSSELESEDASDTTSFVTNDTIPHKRDKVSKKPVASYMVPIGNPKYGYRFGVNVYETSNTFRYVLDMHYESLNITDTLKLPNFGTWPVVEVRPGKEKLSCIIGFLDKKKEFREYKLLTAKNDKLKLIVIKRYTVGYYSDTK
jgi:hypothetical protein